MAHIISSIIVEIKGFILSKGIYKMHTERVDYPVLL